MSHNSDPFDVLVFIVVRHNNGTIYMYRIAGFPRATAGTTLQELAQICPKLAPKLIFEFEARNAQWATKFSRYHTSILVLNLVERYTVPF